MRSIRVFFAVTLTVAISACANDSMEDLREFVAAAHKGRKPNIEPLPEIKPQEPFAYAAEKLVDPFSPRNLKSQALQTSGGGPRPDLNRRKEPLEDFPLDALKMVGTLARGKQAWAVIMAPDGTVHRASIGNHLGQNFGTITRISDDKIDLVELVQGSLGDWVERPASVALVEQ